MIASNPDSLKPIATDLASTRLRRCFPEQPTITTQLREESWHNWHGNLNFTVKVGTPTEVPEVVELVRYAEAHDLKVGIAGSSWSYTDCAVSENGMLLIDTSKLNADLKSKIDREGVHPETRAKFNRYEWVHVGAGMKIHELNTLVDFYGMQMPTLGGSRGQSIAGAISTSTHGSDIARGPIANMLLAIHLVGPTGKEFWIERNNMFTRVLRPDEMELLKQQGVFCPGLELIYDDDLFNTCLTSLGCAGVICSVVVQMWNRSYLKKVVVDQSWDLAQTLIPATANYPYPADFVELIINPSTRNCKVVTCHQLEQDPVIPAPKIPEGGLSGGADKALGDILIGVLIGPGPLGVLTASMTQYLGDKMVEFGALQALPFYGQVEGIKLMEETIKPFEDMFNAFKNLAELPHHDEKDQPELIVNLINLIWRIGLFVPNGRQVIDKVQEELISYFRKNDTTINKTYLIKTEEDGPQNHSAILKNVASFEYVVPVEKGIEFINGILRITDECRNSADAFFNILNIRFTGQSSALLGIQQYENNCHVEIYIYRGLRGNDRFVQQLYAFVKEFKAIPHWGQLHQETTDFQSLYGDKLTRWRNSIHLIGAKSADRHQVFHSNFARKRGLL